jgi:hypothetical protein
VSFQLDKATRDRILRAFLRSIPGVPAGPELYDLVVNIKRSQTDLDVQVAQVVEALGNTSTLINTLQQNLDERMAKLQHLREEHQRYSDLAQIEAEKAGCYSGKLKRRWVKTKEKSGGLP